MLPYERQPFVWLEKQTAPTTLALTPSTRSTENLLDYGVVNIDKPAGPTSHQTSAYVKKIVGKTKSGHSGTLDPGVTGCLPVALERGTRVVHALLKAGKEYICHMRLHEEVSQKDLAKAIKKFTGKIHQLPPVKSSVKRRWRYRTVYELELLEVNGKDILFRVACEAGTYIRKLCHDMGLFLKVGAHMRELRRSQAGPFKEDTLVTLQDLEAAYHFYKEGDDSLLRAVIQPMEQAVKHLKQIVLTDDAVESVSHGATLKVPGVIKIHDTIEPDEQIALMTQNGVLVALATAKMRSDKVVSNERGIAAKPEAVFWTQASNQPSNSSK